MTSRFAWTPAAVTRLRNLQAQELTVTQIAERMGVSRGAVAGKLARLQVADRPQGSTIPASPAVTEVAADPSDASATADPSDASAKADAATAMAKANPAAVAVADASAGFAATADAPLVIDAPAPAGGRGRGSAPAPAGPQFRWYALPSGPDGAIAPGGQPQPVMDEAEARQRLAGGPGFVVKQNRRGVRRYDFGIGFAPDPATAVAMTGATPAAPDALRGSVTPFFALPPAGAAPKGKASADAKGKGAPRAQRSRVHVTMELLGRPQGVTVSELVAAYQGEFGDGKVTTARQALVKVPRKFDRKAQRTDARRGEEAVYRIAK